MPRSKSVLEVNHVSRDGSEVDLQLPETNLQWFRVPTNTITFVNRKPPAKTSNPFTTPQSVFEVGKVMERIRTVERENLEQVDEDIEILTKYLKSEDAPKAAISTLEGMRAKQHESWKTAVERIERYSRSDRGYSQGQQLRQPDG